MAIQIPTILAPAPIQFWTVLGVDQPRLIEIHGRECLSRPYSLRLRLRSEAVVPLDLERLVGSRVHARIHLPDSNPLSALLPTPEVRDFCGILSHVSYNGIDDHFTYYTARLKPRLWLLSLNKSFRFFSQKTTKEIVEAILPPDLPVDWRLSSEISGHDACYRNYCVQYGESDLNFVSRLLEEDGLFYFFEHRYDAQPDDPAQHSERLVITDHIEPIPESQVPAYLFDSSRGGNRESTRIRQWREMRSVVSRAIDSLDRHFQRPATLIKAVYPSPSEPEASPQGSRNTPSPETDGHDATLTHYPSGIATRFDGVAPGGGEQVSDLDSLDTMAQRDARIKTQRLALRRAVCAGGGDVASLLPGGSFRVLRGSLDDATSYYVTSVDHRIRLATSIRSGPGTPKLIYRNRFRCHPTSLPYRPPRIAKKPKVKGPVPATVVSDLESTDDQICIDKYGRVKVAFPWQDNEHAPSCWVRVSQFWAGPRWGAFFWPRVGHEVLVAFEHGDPDRPIIVGSVYNAANMPPLTLPQHKLSCGVHSCSHNGNPLNNANVVVFHDKMGAEYLQLHSETHLSISSETKSITRSAGDSISFRGHHWLFDPSGKSSGGGGSDATGDNDAAESSYKESDAKGTLEALEKIFFDFNSGDVEYAVGDTYTKTFGRNFETYFGCNIWLGCDPIEMLEWAASKAGSPALAGAVVAALFGAAGQGTTTFGSRQDIQYGKNVAIHRGAKIEKRCQSAIGTVSVEAKGNETAVDAPAACVCEAAVAVLLLLELIVMLLTRIANAHDTKAWRGFLTFGDIWSRYLLPRLQGLIESAETTLGRIDVALAEADGALEQSESAVQKSVRALVSTDGVAGVSVSAALSEIKVALDSLRNSVERLFEAAAELVGVT